MRAIIVSPTHAFTLRTARRGLSLLPLSLPPHPPRYLPSLSPTTYGTSADFYGSECASLNLDQAYEMLEPGATPDASLGRSRDYLIDLSPKFVMSRGELVKLLVYTGVASYLNWGGVDGSFVYNTKKLYRVPGTPKEMVMSSLVSLMQKNRLRKFGEYLIKCPAAALESPKKVSYSVTYEAGSLGISMDATGSAKGTAAITKVVPGGQSAAGGCVVGDVLMWVGDVNVSELPYPEVLGAIKGATRPLDVKFVGRRTSPEAAAATLPSGGPPGGPKAVTMKALYDHFWLSEDTADFVGHAMALQRDEAYKAQCAAPTMAACKVYVDSLATMVQSTPSFRSPYLYPQYGLSGLPEGFARACAVNGGAFCLNAGDVELLFEDGSTTPSDGGAQIAGVRTKNCRMFGEGAPAACKAPIVIGNPNFFPDSMKKATGEKIVRSIFILDRPVPNTDDSESTMIILPQKWFGRSSDIYITVVGSGHLVAPKGKYIVICSTTVETADPIAELAPALKIIGGTFLKRFNHITERFVPATSGNMNGCYMTNSLDATANFEGVMANALEIYESIFGEPVR